MQFRSLVRRLLLWTAALPALLPAQSVHGVVVDGADRPVPGVLVLLVDSVETESARALSNDRGEFRLRAPRAGTYRLRTLRIGFRPLTAAPITLRGGDDDMQRLVVSGVSIALDTMRVVATSTCRVDRDPASATFAVWEQVRTALRATQLSSGARNMSTTAVNYERTLDRGGRLVLAQHSVVDTRNAVQPWTSLSAETLRRTGYVVDNGAESTVYHAPSLDVLLSSVFVEDHCFRLSTSRDKTLLGIAFEPASTRSAVAEISGTLWLDRASSQLRRLEFGYEHIMREQQAEAGGEMEFVAMRDGSWAISRWSVRMPELQRVVRAQSLGGDQLQVVKIRVDGGELALARRGADTLWSRPPLTIAGEIVDSASHRGVAGAVAMLSGTALEARTDAKGRFIMAGLLPGQYVLEVHTPSLDSVAAAHQSAIAVTDGKEPVRVRVPGARQVLAAVCGTAAMDAQGIVVGAITQRGDTSLPAGLRVVAEWTEGAVRADSGANATATQRWRVVIPGSRGFFRFCSLPVNTDLTLQVEAEGTGAGSAAPVALRVPLESRFARADLVLDKALTRGATLAGFVQGDTTAQPLAGVEVLLPDVSKRTVTNERGEFRIRDIAAGPHRLVVRRIGYGGVDTVVQFGANETVDRRVLLSRLQLIDSVIVTANRPERWRALFEENRSLGKGQFFTREELARKEGQSMMSVLQELRGARIFRGTSNHTWLAGNRGSTDIFTPRAEIDIWHDAKPACYSDVFVDNGRAFVGRRLEQLYDLNEITPDRVEALEFYAESRDVPSYISSQRNCGVLIIHTRRGSAR